MGLENQITAFREKMHELQNSLESSNFELRIISTQIETSQKNIDYLNYKLRNFKKLIDTTVTKAQIKELENKLYNELSEKAKHQNSYKIKLQDIRTLTNKLSHLRSSSLRDAHYKLEQLQKEKEETLSSIDKINYDIRHMNIPSPINGYVENLKIRTIGGVVAKGESIMNIVPAGKKLKLEANVHSKDIGFVKNTQKVAIKFDAFPYTQYGTLSGEVCKIAADSFSPDGINYYYKVEVCLKETSIKKKKSIYYIHSGFTTQIDIYTDKRRIIDFFIDPIKVAISHSFKKR